MFEPKRVVQAELLDEHDAPRGEMERSLRDLQRFNRYLGGLSIYRRLLRRFGDVQSLVDVGAGTADNISAADARLRVAVDFKIDHLLYRRDDRAQRVVADARSLPFRSGSVDAVTSAHFFHHFTPEENAEILRESLRAARKGVIVNDTRRHYVPLLFVRLISVLRFVGRITRFDAPASVMRGYTPREVHAIAERVPASRFEVVRMWPYRFGLLLWK